MGRKAREKWQRRHQRFSDNVSAAVVWTPFEECVVDPNAYPPNQAPARIVMNSRYTVAFWPVPEIEGWPEMIHLSIKRNDREAVHDWRDLQRIKNELIGTECEAVELYPAESRLVDTANQYHLFCLPTSKIRFPFGFRERLVTDATSDDPRYAKAKQRPFENPPADNLTSEQFTEYADRTLGKS